MDFSGIDVYLVGGGVVAAILLLLMLRFALRGGREPTPAGLGLKSPNPPAGLGLDPRAGMHSVILSEVPGPAAQGARPATEFAPPAYTPVDTGYGAGRVGSGPAVVHGPGQERPLGSSAESAGISSPATGSARAMATAPSGAAATAPVTGASGVAAFADSVRAEGPRAGQMERDTSPRAGSVICPKCGGRFLSGEMEGPTLMIDGVSREEFQPLLSARECSICGYLEFYTKPPAG
jgi:predicted nucleic-acid-binding Zn-ribbon protein